MFPTAQKAAESPQLPFTEQHFPNVLPAQVALLFAVPHLPFVLTGRALDVGPVLLLPLEVLIVVDERVLLELETAPAATRVTLTQNLLGSLAVLSSAWVESGGLESDLSRKRCRQHTGIARRVVAELVGVVECRPDTYPLPIVVVFPSHEAKFDLQRIAFRVASVGWLEDGLVVSTLGHEHLVRVVDIRMLMRVSISSISSLTVGRQKYG